MGNSVHAPGGSLYAPSGARKYLTRDERHRFLEVAAALPPLERTLCLTLACSGCRISEALALAAGDVDAGVGAVVLRTLKKRGRLVVRLVPVPPDYLALLSDVHGCQAVDRPLWPWHRTKAWQIVKGVMLKADVKGLRHAFGVNAVLSGVPLPLVQNWLGHENRRLRRFTRTCWGRRSARSPRGCGARRYCCENVV